MWRDGRCTRDTYAVDTQRSGRQTLPAKYRCGIGGPGADAIATSPTARLPRWSNRGRVRRSGPTARLSTLRGGHVRGGGPAGRIHRYRLRCKRSASSTSSINAADSVPSRSPARSTEARGRVALPETLRASHGAICTSEVAPVWMATETGDGRAVPSLSVAIERANAPGRSTARGSILW